jgi:glutamyl-tRNA reductase
MEITVLGINNKTAPVDVRECVSLPPDEADEIIRLALAEEGVSEVMVLTTCNRTEIYAVGPDGAPLLGALRRAASGVNPAFATIDKDCFYVLNQHEALMHLAEVASGLDSQVMGENEILGQVRDAFETARAAGATGPSLEHMRHAILLAGRRVRSETDLCCGAISISSAAVSLAKKVFRHLADKRALLIGAGEMADLAGRCLARAGVSAITVVNRSLERAQRLADSLGGEARPLSDLDQALSQADLVISAVAGGQVLLPSESVERVLSTRGGRPLLLIDISVPRSLDPNIAQIETSYLKTIDDLNSIIRYNLQSREKEVPQARRIVEEEVSKFIDWTESLQSETIIRSLAEKLEAIRQDEVEKTLRRGGELSPSDLEKLTRSIVDKILYSPVSALRKKSAGPRELDLCRDLFGLNGRDTPEKRRGAP